MKSSSTRAVPAATHGIVCRLPPSEKLSYFGWPTLTRLADGTLHVVASGFRSAHACPFGQTVLVSSRDDGRTWSAPRSINDSPLDDRDAGIVSLGGAGLLVSWFTSENRQFLKDPSWQGKEEVETWRPTLEALTEEQIRQNQGSWVMRSEDGGATWGARARSLVTSPHGPLRLRDGSLLYLGKPYTTKEELSVSTISAARSVDRGSSWTVLGQVPLAPGTHSANYHEPYAIELPSGRILGLIRVENHAGKDLPAGIPSFSMVQTVSDDGGRAWSVPRPLGFHGSPPHLLRHSSGTLILSYGYREKPWGQRAALSRDDGETWSHDHVIRDDGPDWDLGYPSTVELGDGSMLTVCYQKAAAGEKCSLLWSRWRLPSA
jgi:hypothetical protein